MEDILLVNWWKDYIYDGLLEYLNAIVSKETDQMTYVINHKSKILPNMLCYYLYFIEKLCLIPNDTNDNPFLKIDDTL